MADGVVVIDTKLNTSGAESGMSKLKSSLSGMGSAAGKVASGGLKLATNALKAGTVAAVGLTAAAVKVGSGFDSSMSKVAAISGATGKDLDRLREKAIEMGNYTVFSAQESAEAFQYMSMAGWKTEDMLDGIDGIMNLAAASGEDLATTSDIVTDALTAFGLQASDSGHFADILAAASSNANTNVGMMGETFKYVAPVAGALGYSAEDAALAIGLMANAGIKSSQAGTSLRSILTRLSTDAGASAKKLGAAGVLTEKLGVAFYDTEGKARPLNDVLMESREAWKGLTDEQQVTYGKMIAGQEGVSAWMAIMNASSSDVDKLTGALENCDGAAEDMANTMNDNLEGALKILKSNLETLGIRVFDSFKEGLKDSAVIAQDYVQTMTKAFEKNGKKELIRVISDKILPDMIKRANEKIPEFLNFGFDLANNITKGITKNIPKITPGVNAVISEISRGFTTYLANFTEMGSKIVVTIAEGISRNSGQIGNDVGRSLSRIVSSVSKMIPTLLQAGIDLALGLAEGIGKAAPNILKSGGQMITNLINVIIKSLPNIVKTASDLMENFGNGIKENLPSITKKGLDLIEGLVDSISENLPDLINSGIEMIKNIAQGLMDSLPILIERVPTIVSKIANLINDNAPKILKGGVELIVILVKGILSAIPTLVKNIPKIITAILDVWEAFNWLNLGKTIITGIKNGATSLLSSLKNTAGKVRTSITDALNQLPSKLGTLAKNALSDMSNHFKSGVSTMKSSVKTIADGIVSQIKGIPNQFISIGEDILKGLWKGMSDMQGWVINKVKNLGSSLIDGIKDVLGIHSPSKVAEDEVGKNVAKGVGKGMEKNSKSAVDSAKKMAKKVIEAAKEATDASNWFEKSTLTGEKAVQRWEKALKKLTKGTNEYKTAQKYLAEAQKKSKQEIIDAAKETTDASNWFEKSTKTGQSAVKEWQNALSKLIKGTNEYKTAKKYLAEAEKKARQGLLDAAIAATGASNWFEKSTLTGQDAVKKWEETLRKLKKGTKEYAEAIKYLAQAQKNVRQEIFDSAVEATGASNWFEESVLTGQAAVEKWEETLSKLNKGTKEYADAVVYLSMAQKKSRQELIDTAIAATGASNWIEESVLTGQAAVWEWEKTVASLTKGTEEYNEAVLYLSRAQTQFRKDILNTTIELTGASNWFDEVTLTSKQVVYQWESAIASLTEGTYEYREAQKYLAEAQRRVRQEFIDTAIEATGASDWFKESILTGKDAVSMWEETVASLTRGTSEYKEAVKYLAQAQKQYRQEIIETAISMTNASDWFKEDPLNAKEIVDYWNEVLNQLEVGTEEYAEAQKYLAEAQRRIAEEQKEIIEAYAQAQEDIISEAISNVDSLKTEMDNELSQINESMEKELQSLTESSEKELSSLRESMEKELSSLRESMEKELSSLRESMESEIDGLNSIYEDAVNKRADALYKSMNLFDEFTSTTENTGESMLNALQSQVVGLENYGAVLDSLSDRGVSEAFLDELREMGPEATADLEILNNMTDEQLAEYVSLWERKGELAHEQALKDNEQLRIDTENQISEIKAAYETKMSEVTDLYNFKMQEVVDSSKFKMNEVKENTAKQMEEIKKTYAEKMEETKYLYANKMDSVILEAKNKLSELKDEYVQQLTDIGIDVNEKSEKNGKSLMDGFRAGIDSKKTELSKYIQSVFSGISNTAKNTLDIHSPSRIFRNLGKLSMEGYSIGLEDIDLKKQVQNVFKNGISTLKDISMSITASQTSIPAEASAPVLNFYDTQTSPDAIWQKFYQQQTYGLARSF